MDTSKASASSRKELFFCKHRKSKWNYGFNLHVTIDSPSNLSAKCLSISSLNRELFSFNMLFTILSTTCLKLQLLHWMPLRYSLLSILYQVFFHYLLQNTRILHPNRDHRHLPKGLSTTMAFSIQHLSCWSFPRDIFFLESQGRPFRCTRYCNCWCD